VLVLGLGLSICQCLRQVSRHIGIGTWVIINSSLSVSDVRCLPVAVQLGEITHISISTTPRPNWYKNWIHSRGAQIFATPPYGRRRRPAICSCTSHCWGGHGSLKARKVLIFHSVECRLPKNSHTLSNLLAWPRLDGGWPNCHVIG